MAAVVAESPALALDALGTVQVVAYDLPPALTDTEAALAAWAPTLHETAPGSRASTFARSGGEPFDSVPYALPSPPEPSRESALAVPFLTTRMPNRVMVSPVDSRAWSRPA